MDGFLIGVNAAHWLCHLDWGISWNAVADCMLQLAHNVPRQQPNLGYWQSNALQAHPALHLHRPSTMRLEATDRRALPPYHPRLTSMQVFLCSSQRQALLAFSWLAPLNKPVASRQYR